MARISFDSSLVERCKQESEYGITVAICNINGNTVVGLFVQSCDGALDLFDFAGDGPGGSANIDEMFERFIVVRQMEKTIRKWDRATTKHKGDGDED